MHFIYPQICELWTSQNEELQLLSIDFLFLIFGRAKSEQIIFEHDFCV